VDPALVKAIVRVESNFIASAVNPTDPSAGLMQTTPALASAMLGRQVTTEELKNPTLSISAGTAFLSYLVDRYPLQAAIQMYNLGETKYRRGVRVPGYLARVMRYYREYQKGEMT